MGQGERSEGGEQGRGGKKGSPRMADDLPGNNGSAINFAELHCSKYGGKFSLADIPRRKHHHYCIALGLLSQAGVWEGCHSGMLSRFHGHHKCASGRNSFLFIFWVPNSTESNNRSSIAAAVDSVQQHGFDNIKVDIQQIQNKSSENGVSRRYVRSYCGNPPHHRVSIHRLPLGKPELVCQCWWGVLPLEYQGILVAGHR